MTKPSQTLRYYDKNAQSFIDDTIHADMQGLYDEFVQTLPHTKHQTILDLGCGSGRDSVYFASLGFQVTAVDGSQALIELAQETYAKQSGYSDKTLAIDWHCLTFTYVTEQNWLRKFTGIWACASLLHVPFDKLPSLLDDLLTLLKPDGVMYASFKYGDSERYSNGRFFCDVDEQRWGWIKSQLNHNCADTVWQTEDRRTDRKGEQWLNVLIKL